MNLPVVPAVPVPMLALPLEGGRLLDLDYRHRPSRWVEIPDLRPTVMQQRSEHRYCHQLPLWAAPLGSQEKLDRLLHLEVSSEKL